MSINADYVYLLNKMNSTAQKTQLGTILDNLDAVVSGALTNGKVWIGDGANTAAERTLTGDVTVTNAGVTAIGANKVLIGMLQTNITPSHVVKYAGTSVAEVDADATVTIALVGALTTDVSQVVLRAAANAVYVTKAVLTADTLTVTLSGNGGAGTQVDYVVYRAI